MNEQQEPYSTQNEHLQYLSEQRILSGQTLVERRRWDVHTPEEQHVISAAAGCAAHGLDCAAQRAVQATAGIGWNPFA